VRISARWRRRRSLTAAGTAPNSFKGVHERRRRDDRHRNGGKTVVPIREHVSADRIESTGPEKQRNAVQDDRRGQPGERDPEQRAAGPVTKSAPSDAIPHYTASHAAEQPQNDQEEQYNRTPRQKHQTEQIVMPSAGKQRVGV